MECQSSLDEPSVRLIADSSVVIYVDETGFSKEIWDALPHSVAVVEEVLRELEQGQQYGHKNALKLRRLVCQGRIEIVKLGDIGENYYRRLISGRGSQTLHDGETATVAYALEHDTVALVDEHKANKICEEQFSSMKRGCTVDILSHSTILNALGNNQLIEAVFRALIEGRMRVPRHHYDWVINLIGDTRAQQCPSLTRLRRTS